MRRSGRGSAVLEFVPERRRSDEFATPDGVGDDVANSPVCTRRRLVPPVVGNSQKGALEDVLGSSVDDGNVLFHGSILADPAGSWLLRSDPTQPFARLLVITYPNGALWYPERLTGEAA